MANKMSVISLPVSCIQIPDNALLKSIDFHRFFRLKYYVIISPVLRNFIVEISTEVFTGSSYRSHNVNETRNIHFFGLFCRKEIIT